MRASASGRSRCDANRSRAVRFPRVACAARPARAGGRPPATWVPDRREHRSVGDCGEERPRCAGSAPGIGPVPRISPSPVPLARPVHGRRLRRPAAGARCGEQSGSVSSASELESGSGTRLAAFVGLTALAAWRYASIEAKPPTARVFAVVALAIVGAALLMLTRPREQASGGARLRAAVSRVLVGGLLLTLALLAIGVPAHLLLPAGWGTFRHDLHRGLGAVATTLWPYAGRNAWTRLDILLAIAVVPLAAAALAFWPAKPGDPSSGARYRIRRLGALALLLALYVTGVLDSSGGSATLE